MSFHSSASALSSFCSASSSSLVSASEVSSLSASDDISSSEAVISSCTVSSSCNFVSSSSISIFLFFLLIIMYSFFNKTIQIVCQHSKDCTTNIIRQQPLNYYLANLNLVHFVFLFLYLLVVNILIVAHKLINRTVRC